MCKLFILSIITFLSLNSRAVGQIAVDTLCTNATTQRETEKCLLSSYNKSNRQLQNIYDKIITRLKKTDRAQCVKAVVKSETSWLIYRNQYVNVWGQLYSGGSSQYVMELDCKIRMTYLRIQELTILYDELNK